MSDTSKSKFSVSFHKGERITDSTLSNDSCWHSITSIDFSNKADRIAEVVKPHLIGRSFEIEQILKAYDRVCGDRLSEVIFVNGTAGIGKTSLVETLREAVVKSGGLYVSGKFDQIRQPDSYAALVSVFDDICDLTAQSKEADKVKSVLIESLGEELKVFARFVSGVINLTGISVTVSDEVHCTDFSIGKEFIEFKQQCKSFLNSVVSAKFPIVIFFDDLQFADDDSIEILQSLLESVHMNTLFIVAYRDSTNGPQNELVKKSKEPSFTKRPVVDIEVKNLCYDDLNKMISVHLSHKPNITASLSDICHKKTMGNPFYVLQYLKLLQSSKLLTLSVESEQWEWDEERVQSETDVTCNVLEVIRDKLHNIKVEVCEILKLAACLGFMFETEMLFIVARAQILLSAASNITTLDYSDNNIFLQSILSIARKECYIEKGREGMYKWSHNCLMQTFSSMIPEDERMKLHLFIGESIMKNGARLTDRQKLLMVNQLNMGTTCVEGPEKKLLLSKLNLEAGEISYSKFAFADGLEYFECGVALLPKKAWRNEYELSLKLHTNAANAALGIGNTGKTRIMVDAILENGKTLGDKVLAHRINVSLLCSLGFYEESIHSVVLVLKQLGVKLPKHPNLFNIFHELSITRRCLNKKSVDEILALPKMEECRVRSMQILSCIARDVYLHTRDLVVIICLRMVRLSLQHGICEYSPQGFLMYGLIQVGMKNFREAYRIGALSLRLSEKLQTSKADVYAFYTSINHWRNPFVGVEKKLLEGYHNGMDAGQVSNALFAGFNAGYAMLCSGCILQETVQQLRLIHDRMIEFNEILGLQYLRPVLQSALNLMGESENPVVLNGEIMRVEDRECSSSGSNPKEHGTILSSLLSFQLACLFGSWYLADHYLELFCKEKIFHRSKNCHFAYCFFNLYAAINYFEQYRLTGQRKNRVRFRKVKKEMKRSIDAGNVLYKPMIKLLEAEEIVLKANITLVQAAFDAAITEMAQAGYLNLEAFCNERAGDAVKHYFKDREVASMFYLNAKRKYKKWGAAAKVERVRKKYENLILKKTKYPSTIIESF